MSIQCDARSLDAVGHIGGTQRLLQAVPHEAQGTRYARVVRGENLRAATLDDSAEGHGDGTFRARAAAENAVEHSGGKPALLPVVIALTPV